MKNMKVDSSLPSSYTPGFKGSTFGGLRTGKGMENFVQFDTRVNKIIQRTYNVKSFRFNAPKSLFYKAGQFFFLAIKIKGEVKRKHFSFSSSPTEQGYVEFTKKLTGHEFSNGLDALKEGDWGRIMGPYGGFTFEGQYKKIAMITGGIGITAIRSICKFCTDKHSETDVILLYGNRTEKDIVFRGDLEEMQKQNTNFKVVHILSEPASKEWSGRVGHIDKETVEQEIADYSERAFYICGPPGLVESMQKLLAELKIPERQIITEKFLGY